MLVEFSPVYIACIRVTLRVLIVAVPKLQDRKGTLDPTGKVLVILGIMHYQPWACHSGMETEASPGLTISNSEDLAQQRK